MRQLVPVATLILLHAPPASAQVECARWGSWDFSDRPTVEQVTVCLEAGEDVNAANEDGWTLLHLAAQENSAAVVRLLLEAGRLPDPGAPMKTIDNLAVAGLFTILALPASARANC